MCDHTEPDSEPTSSFNFLHDGSEPEEDGGSSFDFLKPEPPVDDEQTGSGFSFLIQETESHDTKQPSHDESHDSLTKKQSHNESCDRLPTSPRDESHDQAVDNLSIASDRTSDSAHSEGRTVHMVPKQQPPSSSGKKKKRRALRPGQENREEACSESLLVEELSVTVSPLREQFSPTIIEESKIEKGVDEVDSGLKATASLSSVPVESILHEAEPEQTREEKEVEQQPPQPEQAIESSKKVSKDGSIDGRVEEALDDKEPETQELVNLSESEQTHEQSTPIETVNNDLADVFTVESANYKVELSAQEELVTLLESFESGLQKIRYSMHVQDGGTVL